MQQVVPSREELVALVDAYRHEREVHRRAPTGSHPRDLAGKRIAELDATFERLLRAWSVDERLRQAWRNTFHRGAPFPLRPEPVARLLFFGRAENGSELRAVAAPDGRVDLVVDGSVLERAPALAMNNGEDGARVRIGNVVYNEVFDASPEALGALRRWVAAPQGEPPWRCAVELARDGLIERHFELTGRGRRALRPVAPRARTPEPV